MNTRRASATCLAVLLTLGSATTAGASPTPASASNGSASQSSTICVALVVDFSDLGGGVSSSCARVAKGSTGADVLQAAGHRLTVCNDGIIGEIDGKPANGCQTKDSTHYWSYWHRAPGSSHWVYSTEGAGTYQPANASTDGWRWQNGGKANTQPANVPYDQICKPSPSPSPRRSPSTSAAPVATATTASTAPATTHHRHDPRHHRPAATTTAPATATPATTLDPTPSAAARSTPATLARSVHPAGGPRWWLVALVLAVAVTLGGAAVARSRRTGRGR